MLGNQIRTLRVSYFWTQEYLAKQLNVAVSTVSGYENGSRKPDIETLTRIAELFEVSIDYLVGRPNSKRSLDLAEPELWDDIELELDNEPLSREDKQYLLAIIREKRNLNRLNQNKTGHHQK
jgi:transcriptional regulator with XRE-family HTH domain